jgi:starvation-inducible DNA-binding protein
MRSGNRFPTLYPVACSPQSWAAAAVFMLLQACPSVHVNGLARQVSFVRTVLPAELEWLRIVNLRVADASLDLLLRRHAHDVGITVLRREGGRGGSGGEVGLGNRRAPLSGAPSEGTGTRDQGSGDQGIEEDANMATTQAVKTEAASAAKELNKDNAQDNQVVEELRRQTANAFVLYANYKHYHWQTFGPLFRDMHKLFDQLANEVLGTLDELAERVRMIGQDPPAHLIDASDLASVSAAAPHSNLREMVEEADRNALIVIKEMRHGARTAEKHDDPGTVDVFSRTVQIHEKHEWWLRDILRTGDGLCSTAK